MDHGKAVLSKHFVETCERGAALRDDIALVDVDLRG
jgi:hypothetical protein